MAAKFFKRTFLSLAIVSSITSCSQTTPQPTKPAIEHSPYKSIGVLEHRGRYYRIEDLLDPNYRAASDDPFVEGFTSETHFASPWAGMHPEPTPKEKLELRLLQRPPHRFDPRNRASGPIPWAGMDQLSRDD